MTICNLNYPENSNVLESVPDFLQIADPTQSFNRDDLRTVGLLNNVLLESKDLSEYPALESRYNQGPISDQEFADFMIQNGLAIEFVQETFVKDFPIEVNPVQLRQMVSSLSENDESDQGRNVTGTRDPQNIERILSLQNSYYAGSFSSSFNVSLCSNFTNPFASIIPALASAANLVDSLSSLIADINDFSLVSIIQDLVGKVNSFKEQLVSQIDAIKDQMLNKLNVISDKANRLFNQLASIPKATYKFIQKKVNQAKRFFSDENLNSIKDKARNLLDQSINQFESLLPDALNFILLKACGLSSLIEQLMSDPVNRVQSLVDNYSQSRESISVHTIQTRNNVRSLGAPRISTKESAETRRVATINYNRANPGSEIPGDITNDERLLLNKINENGLQGYFSFVEGRNIREMGKFSQQEFEKNKDKPLHQEYYDASENYHMTVEGTIVDAGWGKVKPGVWLRLIRAIEGARNSIGFNKILTITSAYRSPYYNRFIVDGASRSKHMYGEALDISYANLTFEEGEELIRQASRFGFGGISHYPGSTFTHFDARPQRISWGDNGSYASVINAHQLIT